MVERDPKKFDPARAASLDAVEREDYLPSEKLVALLELDGSETILDYGAGTGRLALLAAERAPRGRVAAVDENAEMFEHLRSHLATAPNAEALLIVANRVPLGDGAVDRILAVNILHEVRDEAALSEMHRVLTPMGVLLVVDWERGRPRQGGPPDDILCTAREAASELRLNGFDTTEIDAGLPFHFAIRATPAGANGE